MILELTLRCDCKFSWGRIQTEHTYLLHPQNFGRSWQGFRLSVTIFLHQFIAFFDLKYPSISSHMPIFVYCWLVYNAFTGSELIVPETCHRVWLQMFSWTYPNRIYIFASPAILWEMVTRVLVFVISHVVINTFIGFQSVPQVIWVWSCVYKCRPKGHKGPLV